MRRAADRRCRIVKLARLGFGGRDEVFDPFGRQRWMYRDEAHFADELRDRCEVPHRLVRHLLQQWREIKRATAYGEAVTIGRSLGEEFVENNAATAVVDDDRLSERSRNALRDLAGHEI